MELYSSILKLAPLMLLKLLTMGTFGPSEQDEGLGRIALFARDMAMVVSVVVGGFVAALVVGDVIPPTDVTRWTVVVAGCLSLLVLASHMLHEVATFYRARPPSKELGTQSGPPSASPGRTA